VPTVAHFLLLLGCSGAVRIEKYEDRIRDFSASWKQLFGRLNFGSIDEFEEKYRGMLLKNFRSINYIF